MVRVKRMRLNKQIYIFIFAVFFVSCSTTKDIWNKRPDWMMPDKNKVELQADIPNDLITGFNLSSSIGQTKKMIKDNNLSYKKERIEKRTKIESYRFDGTLLDTKNLFAYKKATSAVDFFDGTMLSSRVSIDAISDENLEEIVNAVYQLLVNFYSNPLSETSIYSFQTYKWDIDNVEVFLSIDKEQKSVLISEVNSKVEESRSFQEFKDEFIEEYQTYEEEVRYGKKEKR